MTLNVNKKGFVIKGNSPWRGMSLYRLYQKAYTPWEWQEKIFRRCRKLGLIVFSTPFDHTAVDFLESLGAPCYKIASFENNDIPLIRKAASTGKPLIISSGMAKPEEIKEAIGTARAAGCKDIIVLKCTSAYPAAASDSNIRSIPRMRKAYRCHIGLSDHTLGVGAAIASVAFGSCLIEKHLTLSRRGKGVDNAFSLEPEEFRSLADGAMLAWQSLGRGSLSPSPVEKKMSIFKRSVYAAEDILSGERLTEKNIRVIRPGYGLQPKHYQALLGKKAKKRLSRGTPLSWSAIGR